ncbi:MAG: oligosaccharide flippase family protein [Thermoguttaceae bacterium]
MSTVSVKTVVRACCPQPLRPLWDRIEASDVGYRLAKGSFWSVLGTVVSSGLALLASILIARLMGRATYGELGIIRTTMAMFGGFAGLSLGLTATKHVAEFRLTDPLRAGRVIALSGVVAFGSAALVAIACFVLAPWLAADTLATPQLTGLLRIGCLILFLEAITGAQTGALAGFEAFKTIARLNTVVGLLNFPVLVAGAWFGGLEGAVWGMTANTAVKWALSHLALRREAARAAVPFGLAGWWREWPTLWNFSLPATLGGFVLGPLSWSCSALIVNQPGGYAEMGVFNAANQWYNAVMLLPCLLGEVVLPVLSEQWGRQRTSQSKRVLRLAIAVNGLLVAPVVLLGVLASPWIMASYGRDFADGWPTLVVILLTAGLVALQYPVGQMIAASGRIWLQTFVTIGWAVSFLGMTWLLVSSGALGLAGARAVACLIQAVWSFAFVTFLLRQADQPGPIDR